MGVVVVALTGRWPPGADRPATVRAGDSARVAAMAPPTPTTATTPARIACRLLTRTAAVVGVIVGSLSCRTAVTATLAKGSRVRAARRSISSAIAGGSQFACTAGPGPVTQGGGGRARRGIGAQAAGDQLQQPRLGDAVEVGLHLGGPRCNVVDVEPEPNGGRPVAAYARTEP